MSERMKPPRGTVPRIFPGAFLQLVDDLVAHRKAKQLAARKIVIPVTKQPEKKINALRQAIGRYAKK